MDPCPRRRPEANPSRSRHGLATRSRRRLAAAPHDAPSPQQARLRRASASHATAACREEKKGPIAADAHRASLGGTFWWRRGEGMV